MFGMNLLFFFGSGCLDWVFGLLVMDLDRFKMLGTNLTFFGTGMGVWFWMVCVSGVSGISGSGSGSMSGLAVSGKLKRTFLIGFGVLVLIGLFGVLVTCMGRSKS